MTSAFGGRPRLGFASSASIYANACLQAANSTRLLCTLCGWASLVLRLLISSSVISRPFKVVRDVVFSQKMRVDAIPRHMELG